MAGALANYTWQLPPQRLPVLSPCHTLRLARLIATHAIQSEETYFLFVAPAWNTCNLAVLALQAQNVQARCHRMARD